MAYVTDDDRLKQEQEGQTSGQQVSQPATSQSSYVQSGGLGASGVSTAGIGKGGTGGWTNIQSYLSANAGDTGSSKLVQDKIGQQFDQERSNLQSGASQAKSAGEASAKQAHEAKNNVQSWLQDAGKNYSYSDTQNDAYNQNINKTRDALAAQYSGPQSYDYSFDNKTNQYGQVLNDNRAFDQFLGDLYQEKAGGKLSLGGRALQKQLDVSNEGLANTRQGLTKQYQDLGQYRDQTLTDTNNALRNYEQQFRVDQNQARDQLMNSLTGLESNIAQQEAKARADFEAANAQASGQMYSGLALPSSKFYSDPFANIAGQEGFASRNLTYAQLAKEQEALKDKMSGAQSSMIRDQFGRNAEVLNKFLQEQDARFGNTADTEERQYNALLDILNSDKERKKQGFNVR